MSLLLDLIFPVKCLSCSLPDYYLCPHCFSKLKRHSLQGDSLSLYAYQSPLIELISSLKYDFVTHLVPQLVDQIYHDLSSDFPNLLSYWQHSSFVLAPIPLHPLRQNWRGFNQSHLLASSLSKKLSLDYLPDLLLRKDYQTPQASIKNKSQRLKNLSSPFLLNKNAPDHILLFDDVKTTGSTLDSAAQSILNLNPNCKINYLSLAA